MTLDCCNGLKGAGLYGAGRPDNGSHPLFIMHLHCQSIFHSCAVTNAVRCLLRRASKVSSGLHLRLTCLSAIIHNRMQYQATSSLTLMIQKSMVTPPSPMVLYNYHYIGGLIAPIARRHFVYCNIHQMCSSMLFFYFQKLTWLIKECTLWSNGQRYSFMAIQLNKGAQKGNYHESRKGIFLI